MGQPSLKRALGKLDATGLTVSTIVGAGIFASMGPAAEKAGAGLLLAIVLAGIVALCTGLGGAQCGSTFPQPGGAFMWSRALGMPTAGFVAGCCFLGKETVGMSVIALTFGVYLQLLVPGLPIGPVAAAVVIAVTALNYFGVEPTARTMTWLAAVKVVLLLTYFVFASPEIRAVELKPQNWSITGAVAGAALFFFSFEGFQRSAVIAGEVKEPRRTLPFAIVTGFSIGFVVFLLVAAATLGVLGADELARIGEARQEQNVPVFVAAGQAIGRWGSVLVIAAAVVATFAVLMGGVLASSRVGLAMAKSGEVPQWFSAIHDAHKVPHRAVLTMGLLVATLTLLFDLRPLLETSNAFALVWFGITNLATLRLREEQRFYWRSLSWLGLVGCLVFLVTLPIRGLATAGGALLILLLIRHFRRAHDA
jgi:basic amino acid/polyamine antiporter, APA family